MEGGNTEDNGDKSNGNNEKKSDRGVTTSAASSSNFKKRSYTSDVREVEPFLVHFIGFDTATKLEEEELCRKILAEKVLSVVQPLESIYAFHKVEKALIRSISTQFLCCNNGPGEHEDPSCTILRLLCTSWCHLVTLHALYAHRQQGEETLHKMNLLEHLKPVEVAHIINTQVELLLTAFLSTPAIRNGAAGGNVKVSLLLDTMLSIASDQFFLEDDPEDSIQRFYFAPSLTLCCNHFLGNKDSSNRQQQKQNEDLLWNLFARHMFMTCAGSGKSTATPLEVIMSTPILMRMDQTNFDTHLAGPLKFKLLSDRVSAVTTLLQMVKVWIMSRTAESTNTLHATIEEDPLVDLKAHYESPTSIIPAALLLLIDATCSNLGKDLFVHLLLYASLFHRKPSVLVYALKVISLHIVDNLLQQLLLLSTTSHKTHSGLSAPSSPPGNESGVSTTTITTTKFCFPSSTNRLEEVTMILLSVLEKVARTYNVTVVFEGNSTYDTSSVHEEERQVSTVVLNVLYRIRNEWEQQQQKEAGTISNHRQSVILVFETLDLTLESWHKISGRGYSTTSASANDDSNPLPAEITPSITADISILEDAVSIPTMMPAVQPTSHRSNNITNSHGETAEVKNDDSNSTESSNHNGNYANEEKLILFDSMKSGENSHGVVVLSDSVRSEEPCTVEPKLCDSGILPVAYCIESTDQDEILEEVAFAEPYASEKNSSKNTSSRKKRRFYMWLSVGIFFVLLTVLLVGILIPVLSRPKSHVNEREENIYAQLLTVSGPAVFNMSSPQGKAASWLVREDERSLQPTDVNLIQRYILAVLYFATGGDNNWSFCSRKSSKDSTDSGNDSSCMYVKYFDGDRSENATALPFLSKANECQWMGCSCLNPEGEIRNLSIPQNNLTGSLPSEIGQLNLLRELDLSANRLTGVLPDSIGKLLSLERIDVDDNLFTGAIPDSFFDAIKLKFIDFGRNFFSGELSNKWGKLLNLQSLLLFNNQFQGELPSEMGALQQLSNRWVSSCRLRGSIPSSLGNMTALRTLFLDSNELSGTIPDSLARLTNLEQLFLSGNQLSGIFYSDFGKLINLNDLRLKNNRLFGTLPEQLGLVKNLSIVDLSQNNFSGSIPSSLGDLESLIYLDLSQNQLTGTIPLTLGLLNLSIFYAFNNMLTGSVPEELCDYHFAHANDTVIVVDCLQNFTGVMCMTKCCMGFKSSQELDFC